MTTKPVYMWQAFHYQEINFIPTGIPCMETVYYNNLQLLGTPSMCLPVAGKTLATSADARTSLCNVLRRCVRSHLCR